MKTDSSSAGVTVLPVFGGLTHSKAGPHRELCGAAPRFCYSTKQDEKCIWCGHNIRIYQCKLIALPLTLPSPKNTLQVQLEKSRFPFSALPNEARRKKQFFSRLKRVSKTGQLEPISSSFNSSQHLAFVTFFQKRVNFCKFDFS